MYGRKILTLALEMDQQGHGKLVENEDWAFSREGSPELQQPWSRMMEESTRSAQQARRA